MRYWITFIITIGFYIFNSYGQDLYLQATHRLGKEIRSGLVMAMADMNGDRLTDLIRLENGLKVIIDYQVSGDTIFYEQVLDDLLVRSAWSLTIGDVDRNGYNDILAGGNHDGIVYWQLGPNGTILNKNELEGGFDIYVQAANLTDINNDGWLDYFVCNDEGWNFIYINDGTGQLVKQDSIIDFTTDPPSDNSGNYGSIWTDFDLDGDQDLYLSKCKAGAASAEDPRRINRMFVNMGQGHYVDQAPSLGIASGAQSWISEVADLDNDGDFDLIIFNHDRIAEFYRNDNGIYTDLSDSVAVRIQGLIIQALCRDIDNDGWQDIVIGGQAPYLIKNLGGFKFKEMGYLPTVENITSLSIGDLNGDGYQDIYASHAKDFVSPGGTPDELFFAARQNNHWIDFHLEGTSSNPQGAGARLELYGAWGKQIREQRVGEAYGITSSTSTMFGLGIHTAIDSLVLHWPSGLREVYRDLNVDKKYTVVEEKCITTPQSLMYSGDKILCEKESTSLSLNYPWTNLIWNTGDSSSNITIHETGLYFAKGVDGQGCPQTTENIFIQVNPEIKGNTLIVPDTIGCAGSTISLTLPGGSRYLWNTGDTSRTLVISQSGLYYGLSENKCQTYVSDTMTIRINAAALPDVTHAELPGPGRAILTAQGDSIHWYTDAQATILIGTGSPWETPLVEKNTTFYAVNLIQENRAGYNFGEQEPNTSLHTNNQFNGRMYFAVEQEVWLDSLTVFTDKPGRRTIEIYYGDSLYFQKIYQLQEEKNQLYLGLLLIPGTQYFISTNRQTNISTFGIASPQLFRSVGQLSYPYNIPGVISMFRNNFNLEEYYYFYDWKLRLPSLVCASQPVGAKVQIKSTSVQDINHLDDILLYPNPFSQTLYWDSGQRNLSPEGFNWIIFNSYGQKIQTGQNLDPIQTHPWSAGVYVIHVTNKQSSRSFRVIKK